jgi:hypothetical protein
MAALGYANRSDYYVHILGLHSGVEVKFKAILGSFSDTLTSNYNSEEIYGRIDPIMTFQGINRKIAMTLEVPAASAEEAQQNFQSLSRLMSSMYPGYLERGSATTISTAPLHKIKFANWVTSGGQIGGVQTSGLVVAIEGVSFTPNMEAGVIEDGPKILPKQYNLDLKMTVLHTEQIGWQVDGWMGNQNFPYTEGVEDPDAGGPISSPDAPFTTIDPNNPPLGQSQATVEDIVGQSVYDDILARFTTGT